MIIFHQVSEGDSGLYRVRAVNALGEAECEADLYFDGCGGGDDLYLPPGWRDFKRLTWKDEDMRLKAFVDYKEQALTPEDLAEMRKKSGGVPLNRIMEYLASLPNYVPSEQFRHMDRMPFKPGVDEHDYRPVKQGGKCSYPSVFKKGKMEHRGYKSDVAGRILPVWRNIGDPRSRDTSDLNWRPVHPDLFVPELPRRCKSPDSVPVWETDDDIKKLVEFLNSMGCQLKTLVAEIRSEKLGNNYNQRNRKESSKSNAEMHSETFKTASKQGSKVDKFSYIMPNETKETQVHQSTRSAKKVWEERLNSNVVGAQTNAADFTSQFMTEMYQKKDNLSFPELDIDRPALPPKTKIMNSPSRSIFSPTESVENHTAASVKSVEFMPVKEKVKLIAAQQEELNRRDESNTKSSTSTEKKNKGVRVLPPSPVTVRKMSVDEELLQYDEVVTRSTPVTQVMEIMQTKPLSPVQQDVFRSSYQSNAKSIQANEQDYSTLDSGISQSVSNYVTSSESREAHYSSKTSFHQQVMSSGEEIRTGISVPGWANKQSSDNRIAQQEILAKSAADKEIDQALDQLIAETESLVSEDSMFVDSSMQKYQAYTSTTQASNTVNNVTSHAAQQQTKTMYESPAEECRRSFEEAELEAMALESETSNSFSKQSSMVETCSTQSFVMQGQYSRESASHGSTSKAISESESSFRSSKPVRSNSFVRTPDSFTAKKASFSAPSTPLSQRRRLKINQSPCPTDEPESSSKYREGPAAPFQPGFYRPPPLDQEKGHVFKLLRRSSSRSRAADSITPQNGSNYQAVVYI